MDEQPSKEGGSFYDLIATFHDTITGFADRILRDEPIFQSLINNYGIRTALDVGAGTGLHSILLSKLGVAVTAIDTSPAMVDALLRNAPESVSIDLNPFSPRVLLAVLAQIGFRRAALYGDLTRRRFEAAMSKDVVIVAHKL